VGYDPFHFSHGVGSFIALDHVQYLCHLALYSTSSASTPVNSSWTPEDLAPPWHKDWVRRCTTYPKFDQPGLGSLHFISCMSNGPRHQTSSCAIPAGPATLHLSPRSSKSTFLATSQISGISCRTAHRRRAALGNGTLSRALVGKGLPVFRLVIRRADGGEVCHFDMERHERHQRADLYRWVETSAPNSGRR